MSDNKFIAACVMLGVLGLAAVPMSCTMHQNEQITEMVKHGADPVRARCAIEPGPTSCITSSTTVKYTSESKEPIR